MVDNARVLAVKDNTARVVIKDTGSCGGGGCSGCKGCGTSVIDAGNMIGAKIGQDVKVELKSGVYLKTAALIYGLPLVLFVSGIAAGISISGELFGAALGTVLWIMSYLIIKFMDKKFSLSGKAKYEIIDIV